MKKTSLLYKIRMSSEDTNDPCILNEHMQMSTSSQLVNLNKLTVSSSLPNHSTLIAYSPSDKHPNMLSTQGKQMLSNLNHLFKQSVVQFNHMFQTKAYYSNGLYVELANYIQQNIQNPTQSQYFCLPQVFNMSRHLAGQLYKEKYYLA